MPSKRSVKIRFYSTKTFRLVCMIFLTFSFFVIELVVGNITNSLALVADAFHMLSDLIALVIGLFVVRIAKRRSNINTFGWVRGEVVGANINTVFLLALCLTIIFDTIKRYISPEPIENPTLLLIVGSVGLGINIIGLFLFQGYHGHSHDGGTHGHSHNEESHGHSNESDTHGHNDNEESPSPSHGCDAHGHSHSTNDQAKSAHGTDTKVKIEEDSHKTDENHLRTQTYATNIESIEAAIGSSEFRRHSLRALDEAIVDCTNQENDPSANFDAGDSSNKKISKKSKSSSMNMHGVFLHILADALGSVVVIISALIIKFVPRDPNNPKHWTLYVDPTLSVIIVIIITASAIPLLKETTYVLLQTVPRNIEVTSVKKQLLEKVPEIDSIHELHIWRLTSNAIIATAHIRRRSLADYMTIADKVRNFFHSVGIHSTTIQYEQQDNESQINLTDKEEEYGGAISSHSDCLLSCPGEACNTKTCCTKDSIRTNAALNIFTSDTTAEQSVNSRESCIKVGDEALLLHKKNPDCIDRSSESDSLMHGSTS